MKILIITMKHSEKTRTSTKQPERHDYQEKKLLKSVHKLIILLALAVTTISLHRRALKGRRTVLIVILTPAAVAVAAPQSDEFLMNSGTAVPANQIGQFGPCQVN